MPIALKGSTSGQVTLQATATAANNTLTLPSGNGMLVGQSTTTAPTNGQIPIGNGTDYTPATITAGTGITVTNGAGSISIASTIVGGSPLKLAVRTTAATTLTSTYTWYKLTYNTVDYDPDSAYSTANNRFTVPTGGAGTYVIVVSTNCRLAAAGEYYDASVYKNGVILSGAFQGCAAESSSAQATAVIVYSATLAVGDYIEIWGKAESASGTRSANYITGATGWSIWKAA